MGLPLVLTKTKNILCFKLIQTGDIKTKCKIIQFDILSFTSPGHTTIKLHNEHSSRYTS